MDRNSSVVVIPPSFRRAIPGFAIAVLILTTVKINILSDSLWIGNLLVILDYFSDLVMPGKTTVNEWVTGSLAL